MNTGLPPMELHDSKTGRGMAPPPGWVVVRSLENLLLLDDTEHLRPFTRT